MKETFKAIQFDRKQRVAFVIILVLILIGSLINIRGFTSDREKMQDSITLDEVITQKYYYKSYYKSKYNKSSTYRNNKNYPISTQSLSSDQNGKKQNGKNNQRFDSIVSSTHIDTFIQVIVPDDYDLDSVNIEVVKESVDEAFVLGSFDPNTATKDDLMLMYLPEKWIDNVIAYRTKGGVYLKKEDLKKLYTTTTTLYAQIESFIEIDDEGISTLMEKQKKDEDAANQAWLEELVANSNLIDINTTNEETLTKLPMVTPSVARQIAKYRNLLGGFHRIDQLLEVYAIDQSIYDQIIRYLKCEPIIEYLNVNAENISKLNKHPYVGYKKAKVLVRYRQQHGLFKDVIQVQKVGVWDKEEFSLLKPYLTIE